MAFFAFLAALSLLEIAFFCLALIVLVGAVILDRNNYSSRAKWWSGGLVLLAIPVFFYFTQAGSEVRFSDYFVSAVKSIFSVDTLKFVGFWLLLGLGYSVIEFMVTTNKFSRAVGEIWKDLTSSSSELKTWLAGDQIKPVVNANASTEVQEAERRFWYHVTSSYSNLESRARKYASFVSVKIVDETKITSPISGGRLAEYLSAWVVFWPFYAISLILNDVIIELCHLIVNITTPIAQRFVNRVFNNALKTT